MDALLDTDTDTDTDTDNQRLVSSVSAMEVATRTRIGQLRAEQPVSDRTPALGRLVTTCLDLTTEQGLLAGTLAWEHRDPFDRLLRAQATVEGGTLVTADRASASSPDLAVLWW